MLHATAIADQLTPALCAKSVGVRVGIDTVSVSAIAESMATFGERFAQRLFTAQEREAALAVQGERAQAERLAARFAVKEAVIKALDLPEAGVSWRDIELLRGPGGRPALALHGRAAQVAAAIGVGDWAVSLSHDADQACAVVVALQAAAPAEAPPFNEFPTSDSH